ncbi:MAG TPA: DUF4012 domain-containing protein, partial [Candidatus Limnocylindrales bacterium]
RRRRRRRHRRRRPFLLWTGLVLLLLVAAGGALAVFRYLPALGDARALRADLETMAGRVQDAGLGIDRATMDALDGDLVSATGRLDHLRDLLANDPLVALARALPPTAADVRGADDAVSAAGDLISAAGDGLAIGRRFVEIRASQTTGAQAAGAQNASALSQIVELMATSRDRAIAAAAAVARAKQTLAGIPDGLAGEVESVRDAMTARIAKYGPLLDGYLSASARLPAILGWDAPRRYLVLTQNPAEVRPTGGFIGSFGIIAFDKGRITERKFQDVFLLDLPWDYPFIKGPQELHDYLLANKQPWQLADANWSPDFPTSAQDAIRLYANESGDTNIDGVLAITTYTIDELLKVTGPVTVPQFDLTIASGQTTLKLLQAVWAAAAGGSTDRKAVLGPFADRLLASLLGLPPAKWGQLLGDAETFRQGRLLLAWFRDSADQALVAGSGFDGAVRADPGDYVYPVDSNVAPTSKLNAVTTRSLDLKVQIDAVGNARNTFAVTWQNGIETAVGAPYKALPVIGKSRILGMYFRLLVPERSRIEGVSGGSYAPLSDPAVVEAEAGRTAIGTYLRVPPGKTSLTYTWTSPYAADADQAGGTYRLTIQKQPGLLPGPLSLTIRAPAGFHIMDASPALTVRGDTATLVATTFDRDIVVEVRYTPTSIPAP